MSFRTYASPLETAGYAAFLAFCALVFLFLVLPILVVIPLSFSSEPFLTLPLPGLSLRWYQDFFTSTQWLAAIRNSTVIGVATTLAATVLGTAAALGLTRMKPRIRSLIGAVILAPLIVPVIITGVGVYFLYAPLGLSNSLAGLILAHTVLAAPFVVITVSATLQGFDMNLLRAAIGLGAPPLLAFRRVVLPLILPGVASGAVFAFATSFDEIVIALFIAGPAERTVPVQMFNGVREEISPTITAAATLLILVSIAFLAAIEALRRRSERMRGVHR
jgi:putative spermidine/putrescine transport system permease protein